MIDGVLGPRNPNGIAGGHEKSPWSRNYSNSFMVTRKNTDNRLELALDVKDRDAIFKTNRGVDYTKCVLNNRVYFKRALSYHHQRRRACVCLGKHRPGGLSSWSPMTERLEIDTTPDI